MRTIVNTVVTICISCISSLYADSEGFSADAATKEIRDAPSWARMTSNDIKDNGEKLTKILEKYAGLMPDQARTLISKLSAHTGSSFDYDTASKIYVFNRIYFDVPKNVDENGWKVFGGWGGVPKNGGVINALYPLSYKKTGELELTETSGGYSGPSYRGLSEFDHFMKLFGRRQRK